ncbi:hypothetical protein [Paenibacillus solani]|uniref:hypothetical protein n=1 Tax=Paenibacillus solani TaxID=1705565 RepID=UPI003D2C6C7D
MRVKFQLQMVMAKADIKKQKILIERLAEIGITARPLTISNIYNNKIKQLSTDLILGISVVTNSSPGDWITIEYDENEMV